MPARALRIALLALLPLAAVIAFLAFAVALVHGFNTIDLGHPARLAFWLSLVLLPAWILLGLRLAGESWPGLLLVHAGTWLVLGLFVLNLLL